MEKPSINYETLIRITKAISTIRDPEEIVLVTVEGITHALNVKGCTLFLFSPKSDELKLAGSYGLSDEYLDKGPISSLRSIASSLQDGQPVAVFDVADDPRIQYPEAALKEGIASILSVPSIIGDRAIGCVRVYTAEPWEFTLNDVNFLQAVGQIVGMALEIDLPHEVAARLAVVARDGALARVVVEAAPPCALVERQHGVGRERTVAHRGTLKTLDE